MSQERRRIPGRLCIPTKSVGAKAHLNHRQDPRRIPTTFSKQKNSLDPLKFPIRWGMRLPLTSHVLRRVNVIGKETVTGSKRITGALRLTRLVSVSGILSGPAAESSVRIGKTVLSQRSDDDHHGAVSSGSARFIMVDHHDDRAVGVASELFATIHFYRKNFTLDVKS